MEKKQIHLKKTTAYIVKIDANDLMKICKFQCDNILNIINLNSGACFVNGKEKTELDEKLKEQMEFWGKLYNKIYYETEQMKGEES